MLTKKSKYDTIYTGKEKQTKKLKKRRYLTMTELQYYQELGSIIGKELYNIQEY